MDAADREAKEEIRRIVRGRRSGIGPEWAEKASAAVQSAALGLPEYGAARTVFCYLARPEEARTEAILADCWSSGRRVCVPAFRADRRGYAPAWLGRGERTRQADFGILEPYAPAWVTGGSIDLVFVPGLAFDGNGRRVGHGGGHYDGMLCGDLLRTAFKAGLAFEYQVFERVPAGPRDVGMDAVVTDRRVIRIGAAREAGEILQGSGRNWDERQRMKELNGR